MKRFCTCLLLGLVVLTITSCGESAEERTADYIGFVMENNIEAANHVHDQYKDALLENISEIEEAYEELVDAYNLDESDGRARIIANHFEEIDYSLFKNLEDSKICFSNGMEALQEGKESFTWVHELSNVIERDNNYENARKLVADEIDNQYENCRNKIMMYYDNLDANNASEDSEQLGESLVTLEKSNLEIFLAGVDASYAAEKAVGDSFEEKKKEIEEDIDEIIASRGTNKTVQSNDSSESKERSYYTTEELCDGFFMIEGDKFYPFSTVLQDNIQHSSYGLDTYFMYASEMKDDTIPHISRNQKFAFKGDTSKGYNYTIRQLEYSGLTYDLITVSSNDYAFAWTINGKDFMNIKTINGEETDFYRFCKNNGYDRIRAHSVQPNSNKNSGGDIIVSPDFTVDTPLTIGFFGESTDFQEETLYPTIWYATSVSKEDDPFSRKEFYTQLVCEQTMNGYFEYSFPNDIPSGYYSFGPSTMSADTPLPLLIYVD